MQTTALIYTKQREEVEAKISHLSLPGLLPPVRTLVLNLGTRTLALLTDGPTLMMEQRFSLNELRVMVPLLESYPHYCPYEILLAHISANVVTEASIAYCRHRLQEALSRGTRQQELRPLQRALSSLRNKLEHFELGISNVRERGSSLISLTSQSSFYVK
jgi:hypothetical protein